jgi:hypothetical protein
MVRCPVQGMGSNHRTGQRVAVIALHVDHQRRGTRSRSQPAGSRENDDAQEA